MTAFSIVYGTDPTDRFAVSAHVTRAAAREASLLTPNVPEGGRAGGCGYVVEREEDISFGGVLIATIYNAVTGCDVKRFESRAVGAKRLLAALQEKVVPTEEVSIPQPVNEIVMSDMSQDTTNETKTSRGRQPMHPVTAKITLLVDTNPKRPGSSAHQRFELYRSGMTIAEYQAAGGKPGDAKDDAKRGYIRIDG